MNIDIEKIIEYWKSHAEYDMETADAMLKSKRYPYCLFMTHQAIERLLKAQIAKNTKTHAPRGHNLSKFAELSQFPFSKEQLSLLAGIHSF